MDKKVLSTEITQLAERSMVFIISTGDKDRDNDTISPAGWELDNYRRSPVVLWAHDSSQPPIAKAVQVWTDARGLVAQVQFPPRGLYEFADLICDMCKGGFLNSTSVGFLVKEAKPNRVGGKDITKAELLEFSIVSIPSNPNALAQRSVDGAAIQKWVSSKEEIEIDVPAVLRSINAETETGVEVTSELLNEVTKALMPVFVEGIKAGMKAEAESAAKQFVCRMTGRLD